MMGFSMEMYQNHGLCRPGSKSRLFAQFFITSISCESPCRDLELEVHNTWEVLKQELENKDCSTNFYQKGTFMGKGNKKQNYGIITIPCSWFLLSIASSLGELVYFLIKGRGTSEMELVLFSFLTILFTF